MTLRFVGGPFCGYERECSITLATSGWEPPPQLWLRRVDCKVPGRPCGGVHCTTERLPGSVHYRLAGRDERGAVYEHGGLVEPDSFIGVHRERELVSA